MHGCKIMFLSVFSCFKRMFQVFHLDVANILQWLHTCFYSVSDICCKCFSCFECMLQVFHLNVAKVDLVLRHMLQCDPNVIMHARGKQRDGKRRGMATVARLVPACACSRARAVPSVTVYWLGESYGWNQIIL
jgi:hypothetical protein